MSERTTKIYIKYITKLWCINYITKLYNMKLTFQQQNAIRLGVLLIILLGIGVFIYFELKKEQEFNNNLENNLINELSSKDKHVSKKI